MTADASPFRLRKWYLDVVGPDGEVAIAYHARLELGRVGVTYVGLLLSGSSGVSQTQRLGRAAAPRQRSGQAARGTALPATQRKGPDLVWACGPLGLTFAARALAPSVVRTLLDGAGGRLEWRCWQPLARAELTSAPSRDRAATRAPVRLDGLGYVEELELTVPPWSLPIDELRWGRFGSEGGDGLVWIEWRGPSPLRLGLRVTPTSVRRVDVLEVGEEELVWEGGRLRLTDARLLRRDALSGLLPSGRMGERMRALLPAGLLRATEAKWRSRGAFREGGLPEVEGWAIHERVVLR